MDVKTIQMNVIRLYTLVWQEYPNRYDVTIKMDVTKLYKRIWQV